MAVVQVIDHDPDAAPEYGGGMVNHLPMALAALAAMGAPSERQREFAARYSRSHGLTGMSLAQREARDRWAARLGADGCDAVVAAALRDFGESVGAGGFHAAIRVAYALTFGNDADLAAALAYWEVLSFRIDAVGQPQPVDAHTALRTLAAVPYAGTGSGPISARMRDAAAHPAFRAVAEIAPDADSLDALTLAAAAAFARRGDFVALHVMMGTHAVRVLTPFAGEAGAPLLHAFWRAYAAAALACGDVPTLDARVLDTLRAEAPPQWEPLLAAAVASDDDHVSKRRAPPGRSTVSSTTPCSAPLQRGIRTRCSRR